MFRYFARDGDTQLIEVVLVGVGLTILGWFRVSYGPTGAIVFVPDGPVIETWS